VRVVRRIIPALISLVMGVFGRKPKKKIYQAPSPKTSDAPATGPSLRGNGKASRALRKRRRFLISRSFTRFYARKPIGEGAVGPLGVEWRVGLQQWRDGWAGARKNSTTVRRGA